MTVPVVVLGLVTGMSYAALAVGLVLIYRASRVINLAQAAVGSAAAIVLAWLVQDHGVPWWAAFVVALIAAGLAGALTESLVIRRLRDEPRAIVMIATIGVGQLFLAGRIWLIDHTRHRAVFPAPFHASFGVGRSLVLDTSDVLTLAVVPLAAFALAAYLRWTSAGSGIRAASDNADAARLAGIPVGRLTTLVWSLAAVLSAVIAIAAQPGKFPIADPSIDPLGPGLLLRALAAAVLARMVSLPRAVAAGLAIGVLDQVVFYHWPQGGVRDLVLLIVLVSALMFQARGRVRAEEATSWLLTSVVRPLPRALATKRWPTLVGPTLAVLLLLATALLPRSLSNASTLALTTIVPYCIVTLSATIVLGVAGQVSLGQIGFFGVGAAVSYQLSVQAGQPFWLALLLASLAGAAASVIVGLPALRLPGLLFAVTSLGFGLAAQSWLLAQPWMLGAGVTAPRPVIGSLDLSPQRPYFAFCICGLALAIGLTHNLLRSGAARRMLAVRDNEGAAAAFAIPPGRTKLAAFAVAGFLAAFAGALYGHGVQRFGVTSFPVGDGLRVMAMAVIGGLGSIPGAIAGAVFVVGSDHFVHAPVLRLTTTSFGLLVLLLFAPGGFASGLYWVRDRLWRRVLRRSPKGRAAIEPALEPAA